MLLFLVAPSSAGFEPHTLRYEGDFCRLGRQGVGRITCNLSQNDWVSFWRRLTAQSKEYGAPSVSRCGRRLCDCRGRSCVVWVVMCLSSALLWLTRRNPADRQPKKDSIVDRVSTMEFCFIYGKCPIFALLPLISAVLWVFFLVKTINPPSSAPQRQKWQILYRSRVQSFREWIYKEILFYVEKSDIIIKTYAE